MFINTMPRYEILSADSIAVLDRGLAPDRLRDRHPVRQGPEAVELFAKAGQQVDGGRGSSSTRSSCSSRWPRAGPREFRRAGQETRPTTVHIGGDHMVFSGRCTAARSCARGDVRRDATLQDFRQLASLSQAYDELDFGRAA